MMEVGTYVYKKPFFEFDAKITHVTPRKSIAFEWLILEVLNNSKGTEFENESLYNIFTNYFQIGNANTLVLPAVRRLYDLQAINLDFDNNSDLKNYAPKDFEILPLGLEMHKKGLLPGANESEKITFLYDNDNKKLTFEKHKLIRDDELTKSISIFPEKLIRDFLNEQKTNLTQAESKKKNKKKNKIDLDWLKSDTEIGIVEETFEKKRTGYVEEQEKKIILTPDFRWHLEGCKNVEDEEKSLNSFTNDFDKNEENEFAFNAVPTQIQDADKEITQIILNKELKNRIKRDLFGNHLSLVKEFFFEEFEKKNKDNKKDYQVIVVSEALEDSVKITDKSLFIKIKNFVLPENVFYSTEKFNILYESFHVTAGNSSKDISFAYIPREKKYDIEKVFLNLLEEKFQTVPELFLTLSPEKIEGKFVELSKKLSISEKSNLIKKINETSKNIIGENIISEDAASKLLIDKEEIKSLAHNYNDAQKLILECNYTNQLLKNYMEAVISNMPKTDSLAEINSLILLIKKKSSDAIGYFDKKQVFINLYSEKAMVNLVKNIFESNDCQAQNIDIEKKLCKLRELYLETKNNVSCKNFKKAKENINSWKNITGNLCKTFDAEKYLSNYCDELKSILETIKIAK